MVAACEKAWYVLNRIEAFDAHAALVLVDRCGDERVARLAFATF